jgi:hypothetical protein
MRLPTIHLNGTDAQSLFDGYKAAHEAIKAAQEALAQCAPNGRDYYVQKTESGDWTDVPTNEAIYEHRARMAALETIERDLEALALHVMDADPKVRT